MCQHSKKHINTSHPHLTPLGNILRVVSAPWKKKLILGGGIAVRRDDRIISHIDLPVTLLALAGSSADHPMIGHDLTKMKTGGRAMMQYGENYGYLKNNLLTVLEPLRKPSQWLYNAPESYEAQEIDHSLVHEALAHALWPNWAYQNQAHTLAHLPKTTPRLAAAPNNSLDHVES